MDFTNLQRQFGSRSYNRLDEDADTDREELLEKRIYRHTSSLCWLLYCFFILLAIAITLAGVAGYLFYRLHLSNQSGSSGVEDTAARVDIGKIKTFFHYNTSFAIPPPEEGGVEPIWDSMIPNGLGYIKDLSIAPETSVLSTFHQLHCLVNHESVIEIDFQLIKKQYTVRRAFYSTSKTEDLEDFDLGKERKPHVAHCFDYLRQGILCSADPTIELAVDSVDGFLGGGFPRQCRNFLQLKDWAEEHRAFDAHGFLVAKES